MKVVRFLCYGEHGGEVTMLWWKLSRNGVDDVECWWNIVVNVKVVKNGSDDVVDEDDVVGWLKMNRKNGYAGVVFVEGWLWKGWWCALL